MLSLHTALGVYTPQISALVWDPTISGVYGLTPYPTRPETSHT